MNPTVDAASHYCNYSRRELLTMGRANKGTFKTKVIVLQNIQKEDNQYIALNNSLENQTGESLLLDTLQRVTKNKYEPKQEVYEIVTLKTKTMGDDDKEDKKFLSHVFSNGFMFNSKKYSRLSKSGNKARNQKTTFVEEKWKRELFEYLSLGRQPKKTVVSKYELAIGLTESVCDLVPIIPRIVVIPDFKKIVTDTIRTVVPHQTHQEELERIDTLKKADGEWRKKKKQVSKEVFTSEFYTFLERMKEDEWDYYKSHNGWAKAGRQVKYEELGNPIRCHWSKINKKYINYFSEKQTEPIEKPQLTNASIGYDVTEPYISDVKIEPFDGMGIISFTFAQEVSKHLNQSESINAMIFRMPYIKGLMVRFDFHKWCKDNNVSQIIDVYGNCHQVENVDMVISESCFKVSHEYDTPNGEPERLFYSMVDYYNQLEKYGFTKCGIANYAKPLDKQEVYSPLTYQHLLATNITYKELGKLGEPLAKLVRGVAQLDLVSIKAFLNLLDTLEEDSKLKQLRTDIALAIDINPNMIYDERIQKFLKNEVFKKAEGMLQGRLYTEARYQYVTGDCIAFCEHMTNMKVVGFLQKDEFFNGKDEGTRLLIRNPCTSHGQLRKATFISSQNGYVNHLNNITQFNSYDLTTHILAGNDFDGDTILLVSNEIMIRNTIDQEPYNIPLVNFDDKKLSGAVDYNIDNIINWELNNLHNLIGKVTNINTYFQIQAIEEHGDVTVNDHINCICAFKQGEIIDSAKTSQIIEIPWALKKIADRKPYFMQFVDNAPPEQYQYSTEAPLNKFVSKTKKWIERELVFSTAKQIEGIYKPRDMMLNPSKYSEPYILELIEKLTEVYDKYIEKKIELDVRNKAYNSLPKWDKDITVKENIHFEYKNNRETAKKKCSEIESNESILASAAVELAYRKGTYNFAWDVASIGIIENLKSNEMLVKPEIVRLGELKNFDGHDYEGIMSVYKGLGTILNKTIKVDLPDGEFKIKHILGEFYTTVRRARLTPVVIAVSESKKDATTTRCILENYEISFTNPLKIKTIDEIADGILGDTLAVSVHNGIYVNINNENGEHICSIAREDIKKKGVSFIDFDGAKITIKAIKAKKRNSFKAIVDVF
ncbi:hypothetical protein EEL31_23755 [Brevibacillus laterosporus]|nr:hypothetical protein [Brevibacillus laterosporus]TPG71147.1 hypothetical protein EEL31_23755 [Brevibacillus laterosporus]